MLSINEKMEMEFAKQRQSVFLREAELDRLAAQFGHSSLKRAVNRIGKLLVTLGEKLQRRYPGATAETPIEFQMNLSKPRLL